MFLTRLRLPNSPDAVAERARFLRSKYHEHQVLWGLSGAAADAKRDFLYRVDIQDDGLTVLLLSAEPFTAIRAPWRAEVKAYDPAFQPGQVLGFQLRASLTKDIADTGPTARSRTVDMVMQRYVESAGQVSVHEVGQAAAQEWLGRRAEANGFRILNLEFKGYERYGLVKQRKRFSVPASDLTGVLEVTDPALFKARQLQGYGSQKFAGLGLMLVKRAA